MTEPGTLPAARSSAGRVYDRIFAWVCGRSTLYPWHFQWLAVADLRRDLKRILPTVTGRLLDVGCGEKPYARWLTAVAEHVGIDVHPGPAVDIVILPHQPWPLASASFDAVLCTQVLEHVEDLEHVTSEMRRVLKPGGQLIVSVPFAYGEHDAPHDYRRFSGFGVRLLFEGDCDIVELSRQGGIASTIIVLAFNWWDRVMDRSHVTRLAKALTFPLWVIVCGIVNMIGFVLDRLDHTGAFYSNVMLVGRKRQ